MADPLSKWLTSDLLEDRESPQSGVMDPGSLPSSRNPTPPVPSGSPGLADSFGMAMSNAGATTSSGSTMVGGTRDPSGAGLAYYSASQNLVMSLFLGNERCEWTDSRTTCGLSVNAEWLFTGHDDGSISLWTWSVAPAMNLVSGGSDNDFAASSGSSPKQEPLPMALHCILQSASKFPVVSLVPCKLPGRNSGSVACVQSDGTLSLIADNGSCFEAVHLRLIIGVGEVRASCAFGEGRYLAVVGQSASVLVVDLMTMSPTHLLHSHEDWVCSLAAREDSSDSCTLLSCSDDGTVFIWRWRGDTFTADLRRASIVFPRLAGAFPEGEERSEIENPAIEFPCDFEDLLRRKSYSIAFGGSTLLILSPSGDCGYVGTDQIEQVSNGPSQLLARRLVNRQVLDARFLEKVKGETIVVLERDHSITLHNRAKTKTGDYTVFSYEFVTVVLDAVPTSTLRSACAACGAGGCYCSQLVPLKGGGFAVSRGTCVGENLSVQIGKRRWLGNKARGGAETDQQQLIVLVPPPRSYLTLFPTVVVKEVRKGVLQCSLLPKMPSYVDNGDQSARQKKITAINYFHSWFWDEGTCRAIVVGRSDGRLDLFRLQVPMLTPEEVPAKLELIESVQAHHVAITGFSACPTPSSLSEDGSSSSYRTFCSVGADNEVVVFSLTKRSRFSEKEFDLICLFRLTGHHSGVRSLYWDLAASTLHVRCDKIFVWSLLTGALERRTGNSLSFSSSQAAGGGASSSVGAVLFAHTPTSLVSGTFEGDTDPLSRFSGPRRLESNDHEGGDACSCMNHPDAVEFPVRFAPPRSRVGTLLEFDVAELGEVMKRLFEHNLGQGCGAAYSAALSFLHEWGMDTDLDETLRQRFGLVKPSEELRIKYCYRQRFASASTVIVSSKRWGVSEYLTASQNLGLVVLFLNSTTFHGIPLAVSDTLSQLVAAYGIKFPDIFRSRNEWKEPSLTLLAKKAMVVERKDDVASSGVHIAARLLLQRTIERMPAAQRVALVNDWSSRLQRLKETFLAQATSFGPVSNAAAGSSLTPPNGSPTPPLPSNPLMSSSSSSINTIASTTTTVNSVSTASAAATASPHGLMRHQPVIQQQQSQQPQPQTLGGAFRGGKGSVTSLPSLLTGSPQQSHQLHHPHQLHKPRVGSTAAELSALESDSYVVEDDQSQMDERVRALLLSNREYQLLVLLLSMVGVVHPEDLTPATARLVTETLVEAVSARDGPSPYSIHPTSSSLSIPSSLPSPTLPTFLLLPHQQRASSSASGQSSNPVRTVASSSSLTASAPSTTTTATPAPVEAIAINPAFAAELLAKGFPLFRPHIPHMSRLIKKLLLLASDSEDFPQRALAADRALSEVGSAHPVLFIRTIGAEVCKRESTDLYRRKALEVLVALVKSFPVVFLRHLPLVAEIVIKTLDPSEPALRNSCLTASTMALQELVKRYPMVSFHQNSQRFAVGTVESTIIIYDLRTATKWRVLDGTEGPVSAVAFEKEGERMASYGAYERAVRIWATRSPGLFGGLLTIRGTFLHSIPLPAMRDPPTDVAILKECRLEWTGPTEIKLRRECGGQAELFKVS